MSGTRGAGEGFAGAGGGQGTRVGGRGPRTWHGGEVEKVNEGKGDFGYDAASEQCTDMVKAGIIDPIKVVRTALQNAASVAGLMITTEAMIADKPDDKKEMGMPAGGGMGGMGDMGGMGGMGM